MATTDRECLVTGCDNPTPTTGGLYVNHYVGDFEGKLGMSQSLVCDEHAAAIQADSERFDALYEGRGE